MKKPSEVFKSIRFAKGEPRDKPHSSTDDEEHYAVGEKEWEQQVQHAKKMAMQEEKKDKYDEGEYDQEGDMAKSDLRSIIANAQKLHDMIDDADNLPEWCQNKITLAEDYISTVANYMTAEMSESVESLEEGRPSQRHPLEGHEYHKKTNAELEHIAKDAHKAAEAMKGHNTTAENKYRDQANDSATVRYYRQKHGMADWYKKKYGHMKEEVEQLDEISVGTMMKYSDAAEKDRARLNAKWDAKTASEREKEKVIRREKGERRAAVKIKQKTGKYPWQLNKEEVVSEETPPPFDGPYKKTAGTVTDKSGAKHTPMSRARDLARNAALKQAQSMKQKNGMKKESLDESRKSDIVKEVFKKAKKKNDDTFQPEPELGSTVVKADN